jgi:hypothetical protein
MRIVRSTLLAFGLVATASAAPLKYSDADVSLTCPDGWVKLERSRPDRLLFRDPTGSYQFTVSVMIYKTSTDTTKMRAAFDRMVELRVQNERRELASGEEVKLSEVTTIDGGCSVEFFGEEKAHARRFHGKLIMVRGRVVTAYLEGLGKPESEMSSTARTLLATVEMP